MSFLEPVNTNQNDEIFFVEEENDDLLLELEEEHEKEQKDCQEECDHNEITNVGGTDVCILCGMKMEEEMVDNDAKFCYKGGNGKMNSRHHKRKNDERSLFDDLNVLNIPERVIDLADQYYKTIIKNKIYRSKNRKSIVFACTYYSYIDINEPQQPENLAELFELDKKRQSRGILTFNSIIRNRKMKYILPIDLVEKILHDLSIENKNKVFEYIRLLYNYLDQKDLFKGSNPYSVASGLVYYYLKEIMNYDINKNRYSAIVNLTNITFETISNKIKTFVDKHKRFEMIKDHKKLYTT